MSGKRILIVDDTKEIGRMIQAALETLDSTLQVSVLTSAEDALLALPRQPIDLLVVDVRLPGISGLELTRKLRARRQNTKVIQISGIGDPHIRDQAIEMGADQFFSKPLVMSEFLGAVQQLLGMEKGPFGSPPPASVPDLLGGLRHGLCAAAVVLVDEFGSLVALDGDLPHGWAAAAVAGEDTTGLPILEPSLRDAVAESLAAAEKANPLLGNQRGEKALVLRGEVFDLVAAPVTPAFRLLVVLNRSPSAVRLAIALDEVLMAQKRLEKALTELPLAGPTSALRKVEVSKPATKPIGQTGPMGKAAGAPPSPDSAKSSSPVKAAAPVEDERLARELEAMIRKPGKGALKPADVETFWEQLSTRKEGAQEGDPDMLSFDQASKMGLAPRDSE